MDWFLYNNHLRYERVKVHVVLNFVNSLYGLIVVLPFAVASACKHIQYLGYYVDN